MSRLKERKRKREKRQRWRKREERRRGEMVVNVDQKIDHKMPTKIIAEPQDVVAVKGVPKFFRRIFRRGGG